MHEAHKWRRGDDFEVQPERPVLDVIEIHLHAPTHLLGIISWPAQTVDLRPPGEARFDAMPAGITVQPIPEVVIVREGVWPRSYQGHLPPHDIDELGQLVQTGSPQKLTNAR